MLGKLKKNYFLLIVTFLFIYFFFNLLDGERGLISYFEKKDLYIELQKKEKILSNNITEIDHKNSLLTEIIDLDFIETLIREKFLFGKKSETIYILKNNENKN